VQATKEEIGVSSFRTSCGAEVDCLVEVGSELFAVEYKATLSDTRITTAVFDSLQTRLSRHLACVSVSAEQNSVKPFFKNVPAETT
jgi:predicted AAA+ superfamily ATPase